MGSNYRWNDSKPLPDRVLEAGCLNILEKYLKKEFRLKKHLVVQRPTTIAQQTIMLQHQQYKSCYFFNGLGTRGFSRGPALVKEFVSEIVLNN